MSAQNTSETPIEFAYRLQNENAVDQGVHTDGIENMQRDFGRLFPGGILIAHTDGDKREPLVVDLRKILQRLDR